MLHIHHQRSKQSNNLSSSVEINMKQVDGIYKVEMLGQYGWESFSTAFIHDGEFHSASAEHFTVGNYAVEDGGFAMDANLTQFDNQRSLLGRNNIKALPIKFNATIHDGVIDGEARFADDSRHSLRFRLNRLSSLDENNASCN